MADHNRARDLIEEAGREQQLCPACGAPTRSAAHDGFIWLECSTLDHPKPLLQRLVTLDFGHTRRALVREPAPEIAA